jgi:hypothetical protein
MNLISEKMINVDNPSSYIVEKKVSAKNRSTLSNKMCSKEGCKKSEYMSLRDQMNESSPYDYRDNVELLIDPKSSK